MEALGQYMITVTTGALLCGLLLGIAPKGAAQGIFRLLCGAFLTVSLLYPIRRMDLSDFLSLDFLDQLSDGEAVAAMGQEFSHRTLSDIIKAEAEEYILDKAAEAEADLTVQVTVAGEDIPVPTSVSLSGSFTASARSCLESLIAEDLGIPKENQLWIQKNSPNN